MAFDYNEEARKAEERFKGKPASGGLKNILKKASVNNDQDQKND